VSQTTPRKAIVTLAIGQRYVDEFNYQVKDSWDAYAKKHGYDIFVLTEIIDPSCDLSMKSLHWQKLLIGLIPEIAAYDYVVWMDTDIIINPGTAPCIVSSLKGNKIGVASYGTDISPDESATQRYRILDKLFRTTERKLPRHDASMADIYRALGYEKPVSNYINTGVFVFQPKLHNDFLSQCYAKYDRDSIDGSFENLPYSYELQAQDMIQYIDERFNMAWSKYAAIYYPFLYIRDFVEQNPDVAVQCVNVFYHNAYFCHFAGEAHNPVTKGLMTEVKQGTEHVIDALAPGLWKELELTDE